MSAAGTTTFEKMTLNKLWKRSPGIIIMSVLPPRTPMTRDRFIYYIHLAMIVLWLLAGHIREAVILGAILYWSPVARKL